MKLLRNEIGHFLIYTDVSVQFAHKAIRDWLTRSDRKYENFFISTEIGHQIFTKYMMKQVNENATDPDIFTFAVHVADSKDGELKGMFSYYAKKIIHKKPVSFKERLLHEAAEKINHYDGFRMIFEISSSKVDARDDKNFTALFTAASFGHQKTLKALLDLGAKIMYKVEDPRIVESFPDAIEFGKQVGFWGYTALHIASQNNHVEVVKILLLYKSPVNVTNSFGLNAFQLASERGNVGVMDLLLQKNKTLPDDHSLYYASLNGHVKAVRKLLTFHQQKSCLRCNGKLYWLTNETCRLQGHLRRTTIIDTVFEDVTYKTQKINQDNIILLDDWRLLSCETALHAAVKNCHLEVVRLLLQNSLTSLECLDTHGYTPLWTSIENNCTSVFKLLIENGANVSYRCDTKYTVADIDFLQLSEREMLYIQDYKCFKSIGIVHLLAKHNQFDMALYLFKQGYRDWLQTDSDNSTGLHYAACFSNPDMICFFIKVGIPVHINSTNGSTPFHSAVACNSVVSLSVLRREGKIETKIIKELKDNTGSDIMFYVFLQKALDKPTEGNIENTRASIVSFIYEELFDNEYNFSISDIENKTALNYAILNGHFDSIRNLYYISSLKKNVFDWRDLEGKSVLDVAFEAINSLPLDHKQLQFRVETNHKLEYSLSPYELTAVLFLELQPREELETTYKHKIERYIRICATKGRYYALMKLRQFSQKNTTALYSMLLQGSKSVLLQPIKTGGVIPIDIFSCDRYTTAFPLHKIIMNRNNEYWYYSPYHSHLLSNTLEIFSASVLDTCFDRAGYNILHRAALGGHIAAIKFLYKKDMDISKNSYSNLNALELLIRNCPYPVQILSLLLNDIGYSTNRYTVDYFNETEHIISETIINNSTETINFDESAAFLFNAMSDTCNRHLVCKRGNKSLSLIHIAAAKGLKIFINEVYKKCGKSVFTCTNKAGFSPMYLATIFNHTETMRFLENLSLPLRFPKKSAETVLGLKFLFGFKKNPFPTASIWKCISIKNIFPIGRTIDKKNECLFSVTKKEDLNLQIETTNASSIVYHLRTTKHTLQECLLLPELFSIYNKSALPLYGIINSEFYRFLHSQMNYYCSGNEVKFICPSKLQICKEVVNRLVSAADNSTSYMLKLLRQTNYNLRVMQKTIYSNVILQATRNKPMFWNYRLLLTEYGYKRLFSKINHHDHIANIYFKGDYLNVLNFTDSVIKSNLQINIDKEY